VNITHSNIQNSGKLYCYLHRAIVQRHLISYTLAFGPPKYYFLTVPSHDQFNTTCKSDSIQTVYFRYFDVRTVRLVQFIIQTNKCPTLYTYIKGSQKHKYICNTQGVSVYTNVSANYMFRPLLVRPYSIRVNLLSSKTHNGDDIPKAQHFIYIHILKLLIYEGWNFISGNYLFTTDTK